MKQMMIMMMIITIIIMSDIFQYLFYESVCDVGY